MKTVNLIFLPFLRLHCLEKVSAKPLLFSVSPISHLSAFAGGFGSKSSSPSKTGKKKNKRKLGSIGTLDKSGRSKDNEPKLDRFGLPIRTAENFFPQLPSDTEIVGMNSRKSSLDEIKSALSKYISLNLKLFDETGLEKRKLMLRFILLQLLMKSQEK